MRLMSVALCSIISMAGSASAQTAPAPAPAPAAPQSPTFTPPQSFAAPSQLQSLNRIDPFNFRNPERLFPSSRFYETTYQQVQQYGRCAASIGRKRAQDVLSSDPNTVDELNAFRLLTGSGRSCLPYGYRASAVFLRAGLAEALLKQDLRGGATMPIVNTTATIRFLDAEQGRSGARLIDDYRFAALANCMVVSAPTAVKAVLLSEHGSSQEAAALQAALSASPTCSTTRELPALSSRSFIRAYLAESAYRWERLGRS